MLQVHLAPRNSEIGDRRSIAAAADKAAEAPQESGAINNTAGKVGENQSRRKNQVSPSSGARGGLPQLAALAAKEGRGIYEALQQGGLLRPVSEYLPVSESPGKSLLKMR